MNGNLRALPVCTLLLLPAVTQGAGLIIGYNNAAAVATYAQAIMDDIAPFRWYFAHASVGSDMMGGIDDLHAANTTFYPLSSSSTWDTPPESTANALIYEHARGNPGWQAKMDDFHTCVSNGWRFPKVNLILDKLCYIDQDADVSYYIASMTNLEAACPETILVYATMPLMTGSDYDNYRRNLYNDTLRGWVQTNNRVLFDIADIEAHDAAGTAYTFTYNSRTCQRMFSGNSSDGGHLNAQGRQQVARGFYAVCRALLETDRDGDGMSDGRELLAGTCPNSATSCFAFASPPRMEGNTIVSWPSASNRVYSLQRLTDLEAAPVTLLTNAAATPPFNTFTDTVTSAHAFYRIGVGQ